MSSVKSNQTSKRSAEQLHSTQPEGEGEGDNPELQPDSHTDSLEKQRKERLENVNLAIFKDYIK